MEIIGITNSIIGFQDTFQDISSTFQHILQWMKSRITTHSSVQLKNTHISATGQGLPPSLAQSLHVSTTKQF